MSSETKRKKEPPQKKIGLDQMLSMLSSDSVDVPTVPDVSGLGPVAAARALAAHYRTLATRYSATEIDRRARARAMIIIAATIDAYLPASAKASLADAIIEHITARDQEAIFDAGLLWAVPGLVKAKAEEAAEKAKAIAAAKAAAV